MCSELQTAMIGLHALPRSPSRSVLAPLHGGCILYLLLIQHAAHALQDPLKLNIPFIPVAIPLIRPLAPTSSQELPELYLARTQTSKEEVSLPRHSSSWQVAYLNG